MADPRHILDHALGGSKQRALRRSAGARRRSVAISSDIERDRETVTEYVQCVQCGRHWAWEHGSGRLRGWSWRLNGITCGPDCIAGESGVSQEQFLANMEAGMPAHEAARHRPVVGRVEAEPPKSAGGVILP